MKRFVAILMAAAMLLTVLAGCSGSTKPADTTPAADSSTAAAETESAAPSASAITVVLSDVGNNMDPSVANAINTFTIMSHVYDNLLNCNLDFSLQPGVIASWEQPDELTYKLTVGDGFMFQNGEPLEGEDVVYSLTRLENVSQTADLYAQIDSVSAEGNVVTIVLKEANSGFIRDLVEVPVLNKSYCEEVGDAYANAPIGTGPYVMSEFVPGEKAVLTAWADYPGQKASIETITFKAIAEPSAAYIAVEAGDADFTEIDATDYARAEANDNLVFYTGDTTYTAFVAMNTQEPPFDNVNVRKAMAYAYNKEGYLNVKGENYHTIDSMFPMMSEYYYASDDAITYDLEKAKELLAAEGYDESNPLTFEIIGYSNNDVVMQAYQADLKSIGVNVELVTQEFGVFLENMVGMNFQMLTGGWGDIAIAGPLYAELYAASSAVDTDYIVRVSDVDEQGTARNVSFNIIRAEFRKGWDKPELLTPGKIEKYEMEMYFYGMVFKKGHKIRIDISSSELMEAFPNTNTGIDPYTDPKPIKATQTIYHGREYPSHVKLPVLYGL